MRTEIHDDQYRNRDVQRDPLSHVDRVSPGRARSAVRSRPFAPGWPAGDEPAAEGRLMLDDRKAAILHAVVEGYIDTAAPVGSGWVAKAPGVAVSPATVRNEMVALERDGYLIQPHTSAGRVPTDKGYRFFVDSLGGRGYLGEMEAARVRTFFARSHGALERTLQDASLLLSGLTDHAAVITSPHQNTAAVRSVQVVVLSEGVALAVLVLSNGAILKYTLEFDGVLDEESARRANEVLSAGLVNRPLGSTVPAEAAGLDEMVDEVVVMTLDAIRNDQSAREQMYVGGASRMAQAFDAVDTVERVLSLLEEQLVVVSLLRDVIDRGLSVAIGTETGLEPLAECSLVVAPYLVEGDDNTVGTVAVLGPTRMDYSQALAAVAVVSKRLGDRVSEG